MITIYIYVVLSFIDLSVLVMIMYKTNFTFIKLYTRISYKKRYILPIIISFSFLDDVPLVLSQYVYISFNYQCFSVIILLFFNMLMHRQSSMYILVVDHNVTVPKVHRVPNCTHFENKKKKKKEGKSYKFFFIEKK